VERKRCANLTPLPLEDKWRPSGCFSVRERRFIRDWMRSWMILRVCLNAEEKRKSLSGNRTPVIQSGAHWLYPMAREIFSWTRGETPIILIIKPFFYSYSLICVVKCIPIARKRLGKRIPATTNTLIARQLRGRHAFATIEEAVFSM
jgi:hypothetical protein